MYNSFVFIHDIVCVRAKTFQVCLTLCDPVDCMYGSVNSNRVSVNLEGCDGARNGREAQTGGDKCIPMADSC